jgi:hypothetical protein
MNGDQGQLMNSQADRPDTETEWVRQLLREAFGPGPFSDPYLTQEGCAGLRVDLPLLVNEDFHHVLPRILEDLLDTHDQPVSSDQLPEFVIYELARPHPDDRMVGDPPVDMARYRMFTGSQVLAVVAWLEYARTWDVFCYRTHVVDQAISFWKSLAAFPPG